MAKVRKFDITAEEKARWTPIIQRSWDYVAHDALESMGGHCRRSDVVEFACDANRPMGFGASSYGHETWMTKEEYAVLSDWYGSASFKKWMREVFPNTHYCI